MDAVRDFIPWKYDVYPTGSAARQWIGDGSLDPSIEPGPADAEHVDEGSITGYPRLSHEKPGRRGLASDPGAGVVIRYRDSPAR